jgi:uncharacterized protein YqjF (DUF2071 family)
VSDLPTPTPTATRARRATGLHGPAVMGQTWSSIVWCHWPVPAEVVARRLPAGLVPDLFDGAAWVGLVPFEMRDLRVVLAGRRLPAVPTTEHFSEVNVRTYVVGARGPGVWFDTLDASSWLGSAVARVAWSLPYVPATIEASVTDDRRAWSISRRDGTTGAVRASVGGPVESDPLARFLTERYALYARPWWGRRPLWAPVDHPSWSLRSVAEVEVDAGLVRAAGYPVDDSPPHVLAADVVPVRIGVPRPA